MFPALIFYSVNGVSKGNYEHGEHGWFKSRPRSYEPLLKSEAVKLLMQSYPLSSRPSNLYQLQHFLEINKLGPEEALSLSNGEIKKCVRKALLSKTSQGSYAAARRMFYVVRRFLELNDKEVSFNRTERKVLLRRIPKKIGKQHIPTREEIYRMIDAVPRKDVRQQSRARALILCLWQSGVRASCLCTWTYGMFKKQLYPEVKTLVKIKVVAHRLEGVTDCAQDSKLSSYNVGYYWTFLHDEAAQALRDYLDERKASGWQPKDEDPIFVTEGTVSRDQPLDATHLLGVVKSCAQQIGLAPDTVWTHCLRKAFRKSLYRGGVDGDVAEALMGHKLPGSRGSYFDYHDVKFAADEYKRGFWARVDIDRLRDLEDEIGGLKKERERNQQLEARVTDLKARLNGYDSYVKTGMQKFEKERMEKMYQKVEKVNQEAIERAVEKLKIEMSDKDVARKSDLERVVHKVVKKLLEEKKATSSP